MGHAWPREAHNDYSDGKYPAADDVEDADADEERPDAPRISWLEHAAHAACGAPSAADA